MADPHPEPDFFLDVPEKLDDPFPDLKRLRADRPVYYHPPLAAWFVFRYDDVARLFRDPRLGSNRMAGFADAVPAAVRDGVRKVAPYVETFMLLKDGPDHARVRAAVHHGLNPAVVHRLAGPVRESAGGLLVPLLARGRFDAAGEYAFLLPAYVLSDLFGIPPGDRGRIVDWSVAFIDFFNVLPIIEDTARRFVDSGQAFVEYTRRLIAERGDFPRGEFLTVLGGAGLTGDEVAGNVMLLLLAGHVAVRNLVGNALHLLLAHPDQLALVRAEPGRLAAAVEETLRFEPPITLIPRVALEDLDAGGHTIRKGQLVQLSIASANRDEAHFPDADRFDVRREPGRHLGFGVGPHGCFGAALARQIAHTALDVLLRAAPDLAADPDQDIVWYRNAANRGPITLPVKCTPPCP